MMHSLRYTQIPSSLLLLHSLTLSVPQSPPQKIKLLSLQQLVWVSK
ncbi:hypothetical protein GLYMA_15G001250v4 [Glycine max]|nr:hypothetical protein GLYMA_15G001250v4 [Glycine max]KAH1144763.1 hypothetical protein GYH30_040884 [Glycine max]